MANMIQPQPQGQPGQKQPSKPSQIGPLPMAPQGAPQAFQPMAPPNPVQLTQPAAQPQQPGGAGQLMQLIRSLTQGKGPNVG